MARRIAAPDSTAVLLCGGVRRFAAVLPALAFSLSLALSLPVLATAQEVQGSGNSHFTPARQEQKSEPASNKHFTAAPMPKLPKSDEEEPADSIEAAIGIPTNVLFFIVVAVVALFWFTVGGGRKAKIERSQ